ncbi:unnamed protein product [Lymnaea stagnalis]|uniref:Mediator of RNA polymerase II transcription subunit 1 n=1 Tax=Lymnaea stagnalis TaxID=6523 RepID=A0AAV2HS32_LYMST
MAAETGIPSVYLDHQLSHGRVAKRTQGSLIERLRHKNSQNRSWTDSIKSVRSSVAERRMQPDVNEASSVQTCLDTIQRAMKVVSQQTLKERLDLIGRQLGLSTLIQDQKVSLSSDAFHVDVLLDGNTISSVKLANQGDIVDCPDLKDILKKGDFTEFIEHLQGLQSIYQVTSDEKLKSKAFLALQALEKDLNQLSQFQSSISGVANYIHKCPLGIMLPRLAGKPMKLIYFVSPYDLLDKKSLTAHPLTVEAITENFLGQSVTVCIEPVPESAAPNKLQTMPLMIVSKTQDGKSLPSFSAVSKINSMMLPANFVLVLPQSIPISTQLLQKITSLTSLEIHKDAECRSLRTLILESFSDGKIKDSQKLYVSLPDQQHIYFLDGLNGGSQDQQGMMISRIPFTHPTHVPQILNHLRQQLLFNMVIASCIRPAGRKDSSNTIVFEVTAVSLQQLTIVFEHPAYDSMITVDVDITDITNLKCHVACTNPDQTLCSDEAISRVFQRCMSIPVMLRWLIGKGRGQLDKLKEAALAAERERIEKALFLKEMQQRQAKLQATTLPTKGRPPPQPPHPPPLPPPPSYSHHYPTMNHTHNSSNGQSSMIPIMLEVRNVMAGLEEFRNMTEGNKRAGNSILLSPESEKAHNPLLSTLLDEEKMGMGGAQAEVHDSPMLSRLLDDNTSVATTVIPMTCKPLPTSSGKRPRKRRSQSEMSGPGPKHRFGEADGSDRLGSIGSPMSIEMGPGLINQGLSSASTILASIPPGHGPSHHLIHHPMLNHSANARSQGNVIDLTEDNLAGESSLKKLVDSVDKHFPHKDVKTEQDLSMLLNESEAPSRIPNILQNSPSGSKNENASTSLEVFLKGSGEVGRAKDFDPSDVASVHNISNLPKLSSLLLASSDSPTLVLSAPPHKANSNFFSDAQLGSDRAVSINSLLQDVKPSSASLREGLLQQSSSLEHHNDKQNIGIFEKFDMSRQQQNVKMEVGNTEVKTHSAEGKVSLKLRVGPLKQQNIVKPVVKTSHSMDESDIVLSKSSNNIGTFDFKSDEDDDDPLMPYSDRYVYAPSPTTKQKRASDSSLSQKSDKIKKKERSSGTNTKRKREKDESKRERKRKKNEQEPVYRTVENDSKADFKLKIRVAKKPISDKADILSDGKIHQSYEISKKSLSSPVEKLIPPKQELKETISVIGEGVKGKDLNITSNVNKTVSASGKTAHKPSPKSAVSKPAQVSDMSNKTDTKLVSKATIRLKPLTMPNSGSTVNISQSGSKTSSSNLANPNKTERRGSGSATPLVDKRSVALTSLLERRGSTSNVVDRRNSSQSSAASTSSSTTTSNTNTTSNSTSTTTSTNLSLSSILPNAPTGSKIASLPRIPKLSSSSSNTSINRTSSLDPASGTSPAAPSGTKDNNSYNVGPAGRPISNTTSGQSSGGGRLSGSTTAAFNYSSNRQNFNINRLPGPAHRQSSPGVNSGQASQQRSSGLRAHHPSSGNTPTSGNGQKQSTSSHKTSNSLAKTNTSVSNSAVPQKTFSGGTKVVNSGSNNSKMSHSNLSNVHKNVSSGINATGGQRQTSHGNSTRTSNSTNVNRSPNTSGQTKSPSSGKSPNITNAGRSPSLSSASKSPNITNVNRSPNISAYNSGKSPNINASRSPNVTNNTNRPSLNPSSSTKSHSSHKQSPGTTKSSNVNKNAITAAKISSSTNSTTGSTKLSQNKNLSKTTAHISSSTQHLSSTKSHSGTSIFSTGTTTIISSTGDAMTSAGAQKPFQSHLTTVAYHEAVSTVVTTSILKTTSDQAEVSLGAKSGGEITNCAMSEKIARSTSSTPTTPMSADSNKTKFSFPSSRGRKNSLSAIVDKLKHNAVGSVLDLIGPLSASGDGSKHLASDNLKNQKTDSKFGINSLDVSKQDENKIIPCSNLETMDKTFSSVIDSKVTHSLDRSSPLSACISADLLAGKTVNDYVRTIQSDTDLPGKVSYKAMKTLEDRSMNVCKVTDINHGLDLTVSKDKSQSNKAECHLGGSVLLKNTNLENKHVSNKSKDKPCPLRIQPSPPSPTIQSPAPASGKTSSPSISPFQPQSTPNSPMNLPSANSAKLQKDADEQIFKIPSVKPSVEQPEEEVKTAEFVGHLIDNKNGKLDHLVQSSLSKDSQDGKVCLEKSCSAKNSSSAKALSSPLSDISSPENGLVIDDDECLVGKSSTEKNILNCNSNLVKAPLYISSTDKSSCNNSSTQLFMKEDSNNSINLLQADKLSSPMSHTDTATVSPKMGRSSARSPALAMNPSGASTPKCSDSPCEIDDDLMDVALGFGS